MEKRISVQSVLSEGFSIGLKNALSLIGAVFLWLITIWIPYINVGTSIAICSIPIALAKGGTISPLFIFDAKYRQYMGEFFTLIGLMLIGIYPAMLFVFIPAVIISIGWSLSIYILLDKGISPSDALIQSNKATYGYKWTIFFVQFILGIISLLMIFILSRAGAIGFILTGIVCILVSIVSIGCSTVIYRELAQNRDINSISMDENKTPLFD